MRTSMLDYIILYEWLMFAVRWLHVITAIAWIGSSFYFIALDLGLHKRPRACPRGPMARNGRCMAAASTTSRNTWWRPNFCPST
jgi:uncharacterized membrane protein